MLGLSNPMPDFIVHRSDPLNAEPILARLGRSELTPTTHFYIRNHGAIPAIDTMTHKVSVTGLVKRPLSLSIGDLQSRFPARTVVAVMQCAGNRRADLQAKGATSGDPWSSGAIGNAAWTGVSLIDVLREAEIDVAAGRHVAFDALDIARNEGAADAPYGVSIPLDKALCEDVLLAWAMNGEPLTPEHGAPLRAVVPGFAGVRSAKWIGGINVQADPSAAFQQREDYLLFPPEVRADTDDWAKGVPINGMPVNAAICEPEPGARLRSGRTTVRGYAIATDRAITRVDVSANGGRDWTQATLKTKDRSRWAWTLWSAILDLPAGEHDLTVRAWDAAGQTQPADIEHVWNGKGYLCAAWHHVPVTAHDG